MYQSVLVHHAAVQRYRPGQEETTLRALSSVHTDAGIYAVIGEPQEDPAVCEAPTSLPGPLGALSRWVAARFAAVVRPWRSGSQDAPWADRPVPQRDGVDR